jgi:acyl carrier protein
VSADVRAALGEFFESVLHVRAPAEGEDLLNPGRLDSLGLVELVLFLEQRYQVRLDLALLDLQDLRTIETITALVSRHRVAA